MWFVETAGEEKDPVATIDIRGQEVIDGLGMTRGMLVVHGGWAAFTYYLDDLTDIQYAGRTAP